MPFGRFLERGRGELERHAALAAGDADAVAGGSRRDAPLLLSRSGRGLLTSDIRRLVVKYSRLAGIDPASPHMLRHAYATHMLEVLDACPQLRNLSPDGRFVPQPAERISTRFERRGLRLGHGVWDLAYART